MMYHRTCGLVLFLAAASLDLHQPNGASTPPRDGAKQRVADSTLFREPTAEPSAPGGSAAKKEETDQEKQRRKLLGVWQDHYQGKRTMTLNEDGTGTMLVELSGPEVPAMSGTPQPFMLLLECAGIVEQSRAAHWLEVMRPVEVVADGGTVRVEPGPDLEVAIEQPDAATFAVTAQAGDVRGALFDRREPRRSALDREARERARAVAFEALAGLALIPAGVSGRYVERAGGPELRCALMRELLSDPANYRLHNAAVVAGVG